MESHGFEVEVEGGAGIPAALVPLEEKPEMPRDNFQERADKIVGSYSAFVVDSPESFSLADKIISQGMALIKGIKSVHDPICQATNTAHKISTSTRKKLIDPVDQVTKRIGSLMSGYQMERDRKIAAERQALEDKARKEQEDAVAAQVKEMEKAEVAPEVIESVKELALAPVQIEEPKTPVLRSKTGFTLDWEISVKEKALVPAEYLVVDEAAILKVVRATKGQIKIPGVNILETNKVTRRAAK